MIFLSSSVAIIYHAGVLNSKNVNVLLWKMNPWGKHCEVLKNKLRAIPLDFRFSFLEFLLDIEDEAAEEEGVQLPDWSQETLGTLSLFGLSVASGVTDPFPVNLAGAVLPRFASFFPPSACMIYRSLISFLLFIE